MGRSAKRSDRAKRQPRGRGRFLAGPPLRPAPPPRPRRPNGQFKPGPPKPGGPPRNAGDAGNTGIEYALMNTERFRDIMASELDPQTLLNLSHISFAAYCGLVHLIHGPKRDDYTPAANSDYKKRQELQKYTTCIPPGHPYLNVDPEAWNHSNTRFFQDCPAGLDPVIRWCPCILSSNDRSHCRYCWVCSGDNRMDADVFVSQASLPLCASCKAAAEARFPQGYRSCFCAHEVADNKCMPCFHEYYAKAWEDKALEAKRDTRARSYRTGFGERRQLRETPKYLPVMSFVLDDPPPGILPQFLNCPCGKDIIADFAVQPGAYHNAQILGNLNLNQMRSLNWATVCPVCRGLRSYDRLHLPVPGPDEVITSWPQCLLV